MATLAPEPAAMVESETVSTATEHDIFYWCSRLYVSRALLDEAIRHVGAKADDIERYLLYREG